MGLPGSTSPRERIRTTLPCRSRCAEGSGSRRASSGPTGARWRRWSWAGVPRSWPASSTTRASPEISGAVDGLFRLEGADPERTYRAFFVEPKRRLGAVVELKYDPKGPVVVRLQPTATAKGVVVDDKGRPVKGTQILLWMARTKEDRELTKDDFYNEGKFLVYNMFTMEPLLPTYPAEFRYDKLIPGVRYYVSAGETHHPIPILKPGEVLDLGKIVMKKPGMVQNRLQPRVTKSWVLASSWQ